MPPTSARTMSSGGGPPVENAAAAPQHYNNNNNDPQQQQPQHHNPHHRSNGRVLRTHTNNSSSDNNNNMRTASIRTGNNNNSNNANLNTSNNIGTEEDPPNNNNNNNNNNVAQREAIATAAVAAASQPTPMFERLVTEEVQELKAYVRIVENQNRRLAELERVHGDLEVRLEIESKGRQQLEATLEAREREWADKLEHVESDRDQWKRLVEAEKTKNSKLIDQVVRKDQDIHRMLQRKYDHEITRSNRNARPPGPEQRDKPRGPSGASSSSKSPDVRNDTAHKGPHQILAAAGSAEKVRTRNAKSLLMDFFGL